MAAFLPAGAWGRRITPNAEPDAVFDMDQQPETVHITMAAIDPFESVDENAPVAQPMPDNKTQLATLRMMVLQPPTDSDDDEDEDEDEDDQGFNVANMLADDSSDDDDEPNGGPSDPDKSPSARQKKAYKDLKQALAEHDEQDVGPDGINRSADKLKSSPKGKGKAASADDSDDMDLDELEDDDDEDGPGEVQEHVLCTLDPNSHYQQPLDITIPSGDTVLFSVSGTHSIYLTGNIVIPNDESFFDDGEDESEDEEVDDDYPNGLEGLANGDSGSDELDDMDDPRITELGSDEEDEPQEAPTLVKSEIKSEKGKNKRAAEDSPAATPEKVTTTSILEKSLKPEKPGKEDLPNGEPKLSKRQLKNQRKKLKDNAGKAVEVTRTTKTESEDRGEKKSESSETVTSSNGKSDKKVSFAETLVQGPSSAVTPSPDTAKSQTKQKPVQGKSSQDTPKENVKPNKPSVGVKNVDGVIIDDRKLGKGPGAKKGDRVSMRYIGKLEADKRVFDSNKKGGAFAFKVGAGEVIQGWEIGVQGMSMGGERRITVPPRLGYGNKKMDTIPANSTLVFDLKLLEVK